MFFFNLGMISTAEQSYAKTSKHDVIVSKLILPSDCLFGYLDYVELYSGGGVLKIGDGSLVFSLSLERNYEFLFGNWALYIQ